MNHQVGVLGNERRGSVQVNIKEWKGKTYVDIREWYNSGGKWYPTKKGVFVAEDKISDLTTLLEQAEARLSARACRNTYI